MSDDTTLTAEVINSQENSEQVNAHVKVLEDNEWIGDFFVDFERRRDVFMADWGTVKSGGNGVYVDSGAPFWAVEEAADQLNEEHTHRVFDTIDSGPNDI